MPRQSHYTNCFMLATRSQTQCLDDGNTNIEKNRLRKELLKSFFMQTTQTQTKLEKHSRRTIRPFLYFRVKAQGDLIVQQAGRKVCLN